MNQNITPRINYQLIDRVLDYYITKGCQYVEAPWLISKQAEQAVGTEFISGQFSQDARCFVGSAEQSLIDLYFNNEVTKDVSYVSATPCVRLLDNETPTHQETFMKVELTRFVPTKEDAQIHYENFTNLAFELMQSLTKDKLVIERQSETQVDIVREFDNLELGSYGYRQLDDDSYVVYGTGIALPRFQLCTEVNMTYKNIILDDSILDIDSWLPETAIDEIIAVLNELEDNQTE